MRYFSRYLNCTLFFSPIVVRLAIVPVYVRILTSSIDSNCVLSPLYNRGYLRNLFHGCCENWQILRRELLLLFFTLKLLFESELYSTFQVNYMKNNVFLFQFCWQPIKGLNTSTNWRENTMFSCQWLENIISAPKIRNNCSCFVKEKDNNYRKCIESNGEKNHKPITPKWSKEG